MNYLRNLLIAFSLICCCFIKPLTSQADTFGQFAFQSILQSSNISTSNNYSYYQSFFNPQTIYRTYQESVNLNSFNHYNTGHNLGQSYAYNPPTYDICYNFRKDHYRPRPTPNSVCICPVASQLVCLPNQIIQTQDFTHSCGAYASKNISCQRQVCRPLPQTCNCPAITEPTNCGINGQSVLENYSFHCLTGQGTKTCQRRICRVNPTPTCTCPSISPPICGINETLVNGSYSFRCPASGLLKTCQNAACQGVGICTTEVRFCPNGSAMQRDIITCRWKTETCQGGGICTTEVRFCPNGSAMQRDPITCRWKPETCTGGTNSGYYH